jgi:hypothetical protein
MENQKVRLRFETRRPAIRGRRVAFLNKRRSRTWYHQIFHQKSSAPFRAYLPVHPRLPDVGGCLMSQISVGRSLPRRIATTEALRKRKPRNTVPNLARLESPELPPGINPHGEER